MVSGIQRYQQQCIQCTYCTQDTTVYSMAKAAHKCKTQVNRHPTTTQSIEHQTKKLNITQTQYEQILVSYQYQKQTTTRNKTHSSQPIWQTKVSPEIQTNLTCTHADLYNINQGSLATPPHNVNPNNAYLTHTTNQLIQKQYTQYTTQTIYKYYYIRNLKSAQQPTARTTKPIRAPYPTNQNATTTEHVNTFKCYHNSNVHNNNNGKTQ
eukprot:gene13089-8935_t